jgi:osmotically-inducible protein OsmY
MKNNAELQKDVQDAIKWEPLLNAAEIGVTVKEGVVTLTGTVDSYAKKSQAEEATKNVTGVKAVVEKIEIKFGNYGKKDSTEIANEILEALKWNWEVPKDKVKVRVEDGWVTLDGELQWNSQKEAAKKAIGSLVGIKGITDNIKVKSETYNQIEKDDIERALLRNWSIDEKSIHVKIAGSKVTLTGIVNSLYQREEAERIAWNAPGVWNVENKLVIE